VEPSSTGNELLALIRLAEGREIPRPPDATVSGVHRRHTGCRRLLGHGLASDPAGVRLPFVEAMMEVVCE
jgi:hypothetical protein